MVMQRPRQSLPWWKFYARDFLASKAVTLMTLQQRGAYVTLQCVCWNDGSIPGDTAMLARLCGVSEDEFRNIWPGVEPQFEKHGKRLLDPGLEEQRREAAKLHKKLSDAGRRGAEILHGKRRGVAKARPSSGHRPPHGNTDTDAEAEAEPEADREFLSGSSRRAEENANLADSSFSDDLPW